MRLLPPIPVCDDAEFSNDGTERLWLSRKVADEGPVGLIIGLNPSTAGASVESNDHTIKKETAFARAWGWGGFWKGNLFTRIETYSQNLKSMTFDQACGAHGMAVLEAMIPHANAIVVCWGAGVPKDMRHRISSVRACILAFKQPTAPVQCFGLTQGGDPMHPLYLSYEMQMLPFALPARVSRR